MKVLFVSVNRTFDPDTGTVEDLRNAAIHAWRIAPSTAEKCGVVAMVYHGSIVGAFRLVSAIPNPAFPWDSTGRTARPRTSLNLGEMVPIHPSWSRLRPGLRNGVAVVAA